MEDITTINGLDTYFNSALNDWFHLVHAVPFLASVYNNGTILKTAPDFQEGWLDKLLALFKENQDANTGFWTVNNVPNLAATALIVENTFHPQNVEHRGIPVKLTPWLTIQGTPIPQPEAIAASLLSQQQTAPNGTKAAWNNFAFQGNSIQAPQALCDVAATTAAASLLTQIRPLLNESLQFQVDASLRDAWFYIIEHILFKNGTWRTSNLATTTTTPDMLFTFFDTIPWLDIRQNDKLPELTATVKRNENGIFNITWLPTEPYASLRIYLIDDEPAPENGEAKQLTPEQLEKALAAKLTEGRLLVVLQPNGNYFQTMDPLATAQTVVKAAKSRWGITPAQEGANVLSAKLNALPKGLKFLPKSDVQLKVPSLANPTRVCLAAVTPYGEHSKLLVLPDIIPPAEN
ncbi:MAG: hypothetical protein IJJ26_13385 [Victivallales bacterium]|nr:hypothetical protein [Victivallales bacterium]